MHSELTPSATLSCFFSLNSSTVILPMMQDDTLPLTKADGKHILTMMQTVLDRVEEFKDEITGEMTNMKGEMRQHKEDIKNHFDITVENLRSDLLDANKDGISLCKDTLNNHDHRITRLEKTLAA